MKRSEVQTDSTATPSGRVGYSTSHRPGPTAPPSGQRGQLLRATRVTDTFLVITFLFHFFYPKWYLCKCLRQLVFCDIRRIYCWWMVKKKPKLYGSQQLLGCWTVVLFSRCSHQGDEAPSLPLCYGDQVMLNLGLRQRPGGGVDGQVKHFTAGGL